MEVDMVVDNGEQTKASWSSWCLCKTPWPANNEGSEAHPVLDLVSHTYMVRPAAWHSFTATDDCQTKALGAVCAPLLGLVSWLPTDMSKKDHGVSPTT